MNKKVISIVLSLCMVLSCLSIGGINAFAVATDSAFSQAEESADESSSNSYGLADTCQEGVILHAWNWSFNNIKAQMKTIAECGYTSVQTSPVQIAKENTKNVSVGNWWVFYQPAGFSIDNTGGSALGTKSEFKAMCDEAHKYGIHIIVDIVANHLGNNGAWNTLAPRAYQYEQQIANNWLFHNEGNCNDGNAYNVVKGQIGMPDLQTENSVVQQRVLSLLKECIDCGADGFRFDAAKHIETPDDGSNGSQFWPTVINGAKSYYNSKGTYNELYNYGEILNTCGGGRSYGSYTKYISVTDNTTGNDIRNAVQSGNAGGAAKSNYNTGQPANKVVLWAESHDTYSNESKESTYVSDSNINKTWALVGSRNKASALYFARSRGYRGGTLGNIESYQWKSKEVSEVNKFHNYFNGQSEYISSSGSIAYNERGTSGVVLVNCSGTSTNVSVSAHKMASGTYVDRITGNKFTVSGGKISGQIGSTGIAVVYNATPPGPSASVTPGSTSFKTDTLTLTLNYDNATSGQYSIDNGAYQTYTNGQTVTIGAGKAFETVTTVKVRASDGKVTSDEQTYTYTKVDPSKKTTVYFDNSSYGWSGVYAYVYDENTKSEIASWPGEKMQKDAQTGYYYYDLPDEFTDGLVIFTESQSATDHRYPADQERGLEIDGKSKIFKANREWTDYVQIPEQTTASTTAAATAVTTTQPVTLPPSGIMFGDVDLNGNITIRDAVYLQGFLAKELEFSDNQRTAADTTGSGKISIRDVTNVQNYLAHDYSNSGNVGKYAESNTVTVYFENTENWSTPYIHYWNSDETTQWPGEKMTLASSNIYVYEVPKTMTGVIFNNGNGTQTKDLTMPSKSNMIYSYSSDSWKEYK